MDYSRVPEVAPANKAGPARVDRGPRSARRAGLSGPGARRSQSTVVQSIFGIVVFVVVALAALAAVIGLVSHSDAYEQIGRGGLSLGEDAGRAAAPASAAPPASPAEQEAEIRQMLEARSERRVRKGETPLDIDAEMASLVHPGVNDAGLVDEVRQLVIARNERRAKRGKPPLDVEQEVARALRKLNA